MTPAVIIPLVISILTVILAGFTLIVGKENKTSENRQAWTYDQRNDLAKAVSAAYAYINTTTAAEKFKQLEGFDEIHARVELSENPSANEWIPVRRALDLVRASLLDSTATGPSISPHRAVILDHSREELKKNWKLVKFGETSPFYLV